jgi:hypothetical protein
MCVSLKRLGGEIEAPLASGSHLFPGILRLLVEGAESIDLN